MGPWHHGQEIGKKVSSLGAIKFNSDTGLYFREHILAPFLAHYLKDDAPAMSVAPVTAFETGRNRWEDLKTWPSGCASGCEPKATPLYLEAGAKAGFSAPSGGGCVDSMFLSCEAGAVLSAAESASGVCSAADMGAMAGGRSAGVFGTDGCAELYDGCADFSDEDQWGADCEFGGGDDGERCGLGGEADRLSIQRRWRTAGDGWVLSCRWRWIFFGEDIAESLSE